MSIMLTFSNHITKLGGIAPATGTGLRLRIYHANYISSFLLHLDTLLIKFLHTVTSFSHLPGLSHLDNFSMTNRLASVTPKSGNSDLRQASNTAHLPGLKNNAT